MTASVCLTLALLHGLVWCRRPAVWGNFWFAVLAVATAGLALCELWMMHAQTTEQFGVALRWIHVPGALLLIALVWFVRTYLRAGRTWLAWTVCGLRVLLLVLNFVDSPNVNFRKITALRPVSLLGEQVATATGVPNPLMIIGQVALIATVVFVVDAALTVWRRGEYRQAVVIGGAVTFFILASTAQSVLSFWQIVPSPITGSLFFGGIVIAMGYELSRDVLQAAEVQEMRQELAHAGRVMMMGQLATTLAHELNQPLGAILRNAEAAELFLEADSPDMEELRVILGDIRRDDQRAGEVIEQMRRFLSRRAPETKPLDVSALVREVASLIRLDALSRRVVVEVAIAESLPSVRGDRVQMQQVLLNLVLNGMDALNSTGERRVTITAQLNDASGVEIAVSDTGDGIPADKAGKLFAPFFTTKSQGMGMGLAISRSIVEAHGGTIRAENNKHSGATFRVRLPSA